MGNKKVVVIGAGCAGLSATYTLKKHGVDVLTLESTGTAGGRCQQKKKGRFIFSYGAFMTEPQWDTTFRYVEELDMIDQVVPIRANRYGFPRNGKVYYILLGAPLWEELLAIPEFLRFRGLPFKAYPQLVKLGFAMLKYLRALDPTNHDFDVLTDISNTSAAEFTLKHGGQEALDCVMRPFLQDMVLGQPEEITIAHPIALTRLMRGMCTMKYGMGSINAALYEKVKDCVRLSTPVKKVVIENKKVKGVETAEGFIEADQVICATDTFDARQMMPDLPDTIRKPLETCQYSRTFSYMFAVDKKLGPKHFLMHLIPGKEPLIDAAGIVSRDGTATAPPGTCIVHTYTVGLHDEEICKLSEAERRRMVIRETQKYLPGFPDEPLMTEVARYDRAVNLESPGQFPAIRELQKNHLRDVKGLYLAGEYLFLIACTEGAFATGEKAAHMVMEDL